MTLWSYVYVYIIIIIIAIITVIVTIQELLGQVKWLLLMLTELL